MANGALFNIDDMTIEDIEDLAAAMGAKTVAEVNRLTEGDQIPVAVLATVAWITKRKDDPTFTLQQAKRMTVRELNEITDAPSPNSEGGNAASSDSGTPRSSSSTRAPSRRSRSGD